ncbi:MAG: hypothetical protein WCE62_16240 [Polyangiales bacterium]
MPGTLPKALSRFSFRSRHLASILGVSLGFCAALPSGCQTAICEDGLAEIDGVCSERKCNGPCGALQFCDTEATPPECVCAQGFSGNPCTFSGLIEDPGFTLDVDESPWERTPGTTVLNTSPGDDDIGEGALLPIAVCNAGRIFQVVEMPSLESAVPFVAEINYRAQGVHGMAIGFDGAWTRVAPTDAAWTPTRVCLGEGTYGPSPSGGPVTVQLSASERLAECVNGSEPQGRISIDRFTITPASAGECPEPGEVLNGDAEPDGAPWKSSTEGDVTFELVEGAGREGATPGARLVRAAGGTGRGMMWTRMSVPRSTTLESPAVRFWWRATNQEIFGVHAGTIVGLDDRGRQVDTLVGTIDTTVGNNSGLSRLYCLPPWTHGTVIDFGFSLPDTSDEAVELVIGEVSLTSDERCGNDDVLFDRGFESAPIPWFGAALSSASEAVVMKGETALAHTGDGVLDLTYWTSAAEVSMETYVRIPEDEPNPALTFYSRSPTEPSMDVRWFLGRDEEVSGPIRTIDTWQQNEEVCLPPEWAGRWFRVAVRAGPGSEPGAPITQEHVYLDDFALGTCSMGE